MQPFEVNETILSAFERVVSMYPQHNAAVFKNESISYEALNKRANQLAHALLQEGITANSCVSICVERSLEMIIGILGIMKAGAAYVPVDPQFPEERIRHVLINSESKVVVTMEDCKDLIPSDARALKIILDSDQDLNKQPVQNLARKPALQDLAYVIYTSGSTGKPKGVMVEHLSIAVYIQDVFTALDLARHSTFGLIASFSADAGLTALFGALVFGKTIHVFAKEHLENLQLLADHLEKNPVESYKITPSLLRILLSSENPKILLPTKALIFGGEPCPWSLVAQLTAHLPDGCKVYNHYGPTETTVGVITSLLDVNVRPETQGCMPLGLPLASVEVSILNQDLTETPTGKLGELFIAGPLVAKGYWNNESLTEKKFVTLPQHKGRVYRTGDLVRFNENGLLEFQGRIDEQIKIRGYRVEIQEIESCVRSYPEVAEVAIVSHKKNHDNYLVGYVKPETYGFKKADLIAYLKKRLPDYMVPLVWVEMKDFPLTANGKTDKKALPQPEDNISVLHVMPQSDTEKEFVRICEQILQRTSVGVEQSLLELGANSLTLMQVRGYVLKRFRKLLPQKLLFDDLSLRELSTMIDAEPEAVTPPDSSVNYFISETTEAQRQLYFRSKFNPKEIFPNSSLIIELAGPLDTSKLDSSITAITSRHESLRCTFKYMNSKVVKQLHETKPFNIVTVVSEKEDINQVTRDLMEPFDVTVAPLLRVFHIQLKSARFYLFFFMPHINSDGESIDIIAKQVSFIYGGRVVDTQIQNFSSFQAVMNRYLDSNDYLLDETYWLNQFNTPRHCSGKVRTPNNLRHSIDAECCVVAFPSKLRSNLNNVLRKTKFTQFHFLLTAYSILLSKINESGIINVLIPVNNRYEGDLRNASGLLVNTINLRLKIDTCMSMEQLVHEVKINVIEALQHKRYPLENLVTALKRKGQYFQADFSNYFGYHDKQFQYDFGGVSGRAVIAFVNREPLPLAFNIFNAADQTILRTTAICTAYSQAQLSIVTNEYMSILALLTERFQKTGG